MNEVWAQVTRHRDGPGTRTLGILVIVCLGAILWAWLQFRGLRASEYREGVETTVAVESKRLGVPLDRDPSIGSRFRTDSATTRAFQVSSVALKVQAQQLNEPTYVWERISTPSVEDLGGFSRSEMGIALKAAAAQLSAAPEGTVISLIQSVPVGGNLVGVPSSVKLTAAYVGKDSAFYLSSGSMIGQPTVRLRMRSGVYTAVVQGATETRLTYGQAQFGFVASTSVTASSFDLPNESNPPAPNPSGASTAASTTCGDSIRVLFAFSDQAIKENVVRNYSGASLLSFATDLLAEFSLALAGTGSRVRVVVADAIPYGRSDQGVDTIDRDNLVSILSDPSQPLALSRKSTRADLVVLFVGDSPSSCGIAGALGPDDLPTVRSMVAVVGVKCAASYRFSLVHELGHLFGSGHEKADLSVKPKKADAYAFLSPAGYGDVMIRCPAGSPCLRLRAYSDAAPLPAATGLPMLGSSDANVAPFFRETACKIAEYHQRIP